MQRSAHRVSPGSTQPGPGTAGPRSSSEPDLLGTYFRDLAQYDVMDRDAELHAAQAIADHRLHLWRALLAYLPLCAAICGLARELLPTDPQPEAELAELERSLRALRQRELVAHQRAVDAAREALALAMTGADRDGLVSERILADLGSLQTGEPGLSLKAKLPRQDSRPFLAHVAAVRAAHHALWTGKHRFIRANLRLVITVARRFNRGRLPLGDLIQEGNIGLMKAVDRFDPQRGFRFSTYASWWIRHAISRALADTGRAVRLPVHMIDAQSKVARVRREFDALHGREPADAELAAATDLSLERIQRMRWSLVDDPVSLDQPIGSEPGRTLADALADPDEALAPELLDSDLLHDRLRRALGNLPALEASVIAQRMGLADDREQTLKEIGERHALSRERIRQIQAQALRRLRKEFERQDLM
jgi:RNA polymerase primary sigma factor